MGLRPLWWKFVEESGERGDEVRIGGQLFAPFCQLFHKF